MNKKVTELSTGTQLTFYKSQSILCVRLCVCVCSSVWRRYSPASYAVVFFVDNSSSAQKLEKYNKIGFDLYVFLFFLQRHQVDIVVITAILSIDRQRFNFLVNMHDFELLVAMLGLPLNWQLKWPSLVQNCNDNLYVNYMT